MFSTPIHLTPSPISIRRRLVSRRLFVAAALLTISAGWTDIASSGWQTFKFRDGLGSNSVTAIFEDHSGNLWFGTQSGIGSAFGDLSRYNGQTWQTFTTADGLGAHFVAAMLEDRSGNLWARTSVGVSRYDGQIWTTFTTADGLGGDSVA